MYTQHILDKPAPQLRDLADGDTLSVAGRSGTIVKSLKGRLWVTQEGDLNDYVVPPGGRFCAAGNGNIVVSALTDDTQVAIYHVVPEPPADWRRNAVRMNPDFIKAAREAARKEMAQWFAGMISE